MNGQVENPQLTQLEKNYWINRLANCHLRLGECLIWKEDFAGGVQEYAICIELLNKIKDSINPRRIAEIQFQKANAHMYLMDGQSLESALKH